MIPAALRILYPSAPIGTHPDARSGDGRADGHGGVLSLRLRGHDRTCPPEREHGGTVAATRDATWGHVMAMPVSEYHDLDVEQDSYGKWEAYCSCGWTSPPLNDQADAELAWEDHCDEVFMEATMEGGTP